MKRNILIVEDDKACMSALAEMTQKCEAAGVVFCAENSADAYKNAMENEIDLFLIDIVLDKHNPRDASGMVFADNIRKIERYSFTPIIFITSLVDQEMSAFHRLHCFDYIEKPFNMEQVEELIEKALQIPVGDDKQQEVVYYKKDGVLFALVVDEVKYIETHFRNIVVYMTEEEINVPYSSNRQFIRDLPRRYFVQCNRNVILNKKYIEYVDKPNLYVKIRKDKQIKIGGKMKKRFFEEL